MSDHKHKPQKPIIRFLKGSVFFLTLIAIIVVAKVFDLQHIFDGDWAETHLKTQGATGIIIYLLLVSGLSAIGTPRQLLSALGGYAFGSLLGLVLVTTGLLLGCAATFFYSRFLARAALSHRFGKRIKKLDDFLAHSPCLMTITIRLSPVSINAITNILAGLTKIPARSFILGTAIAYLPQNIIFALLGDSLRTDSTLSTIVSIALYIISSIFAYMIYRRYKGAAVLKEEEEEEALGTSVP